MVKRNSNITSKGSSSKGSSSSKKYQSKLSRLHRRLALKPRVASQPHATHEAIDEDHVTTEEGGGDDQQGTLQNEKVYQRGSPMKLIKLYPHMSSKQLQLVKDADFSGLTNIGCSKLCPELCKYLMGCFNPTTCELVFPGRGSIPVTEESVSLVVGVPWGDKEVIYKVDKASTEFMRKEMGRSNRKQPTMAFLWKKLAYKDADANYLRLWTVYAMSSVVAPTTATKVSPRIYPSFCNIEEVTELNVCKFLIRMLIKAAKKHGVEKGILKACMLYFMVLYLDSLELEDIEINQEGTRVSVWTNAMVAKAIIQDTKSDGTFGRAPLKARFCTVNPEAEPSEGQSEGELTPPHDPPMEDVEVDETSLEDSKVETPVGAGDDQKPDNELRDETLVGNNVNLGKDAVDTGSHGNTTGPKSVMFSEPNNISLFVDMNTPAGCTEEEKDSFAEAIKEACYGFEKGLHTLIRGFTFKPSFKNYRQNRRPRHAVSKIRRSSIEGSQSSQTQHNSQESVDTDNKLKGEGRPGSAHPCKENTRGVDKQGAENDELPPQQNYHSEVPPAPKFATTEVALEKQDPHAPAVQPSSKGKEDVKEDFGTSKTCCKVTSSDTQQGTSRSTAAKLESLMQSSHPRPAAKGNSQHLDETHESTSEDGDDDPAMSSEQFRKYLATTPEKPYHRIKKFELPEFLDIEYENPQRAAFKNLLGSLKEKQLETDGLPTYGGETERDELTRTLFDINQVPVKLGCKKRKAVTFADQPELKQKDVNCSPASPSKYRTRGAARLEMESNKGLNIQQVPSPAKGTRRVAPPIAAKEEAEAHQSTTEDQDALARKLIFNSNQSASRKRNLDSAPDAPPFDLGLDDDIVINQAPNIAAGCSKVESGAQDTVAGCSKDDAISNKASIAHAGCSKGQTNAPTASKILSAVMNPSRQVEELYRMVSLHGSKTSSKSNDETVWDDGNIFCSVQALADSVKPSKKLVNIVCEIAIHMMKDENKNPNKVIMPLRISTFLRDERVDHKEVKNAFSAANRLDQKELICFPSLQNFEGCDETSSGHYFVVNLNIKAKRFEVMDSITTRNGESIMMDACHLLVAFIKYMWNKNYRWTSVNISQWPMEMIPPPAQTNGYDCGFFMLKNLESWQGGIDEVPEQFKQSDMPNVRKLFNDKMLRWHANKAEWKLAI